MEHPQVQQQQQQQQEGRSGGPPPEEDHPYIVRRVRDRLSFHEDDDVDVGDDGNDNNNDDNNSNNIGDASGRGGGIHGHLDESKGELGGRVFEEEEENIGGGSQPRRWPLYSSSMLEETRAPAQPQQQPFDVGRHRAPFYRGRSRPISSAPPIPSSEVVDDAGGDEPAGNETDYYPKNANWSCTRCRFTAHCMQPRKNAPASTR